MIFDICIGQSAHLLRPLWFHQSLGYIKPVCWYWKLFVKLQGFFKQSASGSDNIWKCYFYFQYGLLSVITFKSFSNQRNVFGFGYLLLAKGEKRNYLNTKPFKITITSLYEPECKIVISFINRLLMVWWTLDRVEIDYIRYRYHCMDQGWQIGLMDAEIRISSQLD